MKWPLHFISILILTLLLGCSQDKQSSSQTLLLALSDSDGLLNVVDYQVRDNTFVRSRQQGRYQAHIFDDSNVLQKINFERIGISAANNSNPEIDFYVAMPLLTNADRIEIYMLDGSSGHYQLKTDNPLLEWQIPKNIVPKSQRVKE